jgi:hypothetical protein
MTEKKLNDLQVAALDFVGKPQGPDLLIRIYLVGSGYWAY